MLLTGLLIGAIAVVLGFVGGYPLGAKTALELYRQGLCTKTETERLLAFCNNSGPAFILGVVGAGIFGSGQIGLLLYASHCVASLLTGLLFRFYGHEDQRAKATSYPKPIAATTIPAAFTNGVLRSFSNLLNICAFVIFFSALLQLMSYFGVFTAIARLLSLMGVSSRYAPQLVAGLLELTSGVSSLGGVASSAGSISMAAFMLGWAGLSVHCQVLCFLIDSGLSARTYLLGNGLDSVMNYPWRKAILAFVRGEDDGRQLRSAVLSLAENYPAAVLNANLNLLSSHDVPRALTALVDPRDGEREDLAHRTLSPEQLALGKQRLRLASFLQFTLPGAPCIYYGDEAGMTGYRDPFNRGYFPWGREDADLQAHYRSLARLKAAWEPLRRGSVKVLAAGDGRFAFRRTFEGRSVTLWCNASPSAWTDAEQTGKVLFGNPHLPPMSFCAMEEPMC